MAKNISNSNSNTLLSGTSGNDTIGNYGAHVSINAGAGNDSVYNGGENNTISPGSGNDYIDNAWAHGSVYIYGGGNDTINRFRSQNNFLVIENYTWSTVRVQDDNGNNTNNAIVNVLNGKKTVGSIFLEDIWENPFNIVSSKAGVKPYNLIINDSGNGKDKAKLTGTSGKDYVETDGWKNVTVKTGAGNDIINNGYGYGDYEGRSPDNAFIDAGTGNDWIGNNGNGSTINAGAGKDTIHNGADNVSISAGDGNDSIDNGGANVSISAGKGNDSIDNGGDNVTISGGTGNDYINSWGDGMVYVYSGGNDTLQNFQLSSTIVLGKATVKSSLKNYDTGDVTLNMSNGGSIVIKEHWDGVINTVASASAVKSRNIIHNDKNKRKITGTSDSDVIISTNWTDNDPSVGYSKVTINAGAGNDFTKTSGTKNLVNLGDNNDVAENWGSHTTINGGNGNDYIESYREGGEYSSLVGGAGNDSIVNHASYSTVIGGDGNDSLVNNDSHVSISGGKGNDTILSTWTDYNTIAGGAGNDYVELGGNANVYVYSAGNDTLNNFDVFTDTIVLGSVKVSSSVLGDDGTLTLNLSNKKTLKLTNYRDDIATTVKSISDVKDWNIIYNYEGSKTVKGTSKADYIVNHADNVTITAGDDKDLIRNRAWNVSMNAGAGNDTIFSYAPQATLLGGAGNDYLRDRFSPQGLFSGGAGNDTIRVYGRLSTITGGTGNDKISLHSTNELIKYKSGDGNDTIYGFNSTDTLTISGGSYSTQASGSDIVVTVGKGKITLKDVKGNAVYINKKNVGGSSTNKKFIVLTSGNDTLNSSLEGATISGGKGDDVLETDFSDKVSISGGAGNDDIQNWFGNNVTLSGGAGNDNITNYGGDNVSIYGGTGNDTIRNDAALEWNSATNSFDTIDSPDNVSLWGGAGNDLLYGGEGKDIFIYKPGEGNDTILNYANGDLLKITGGTFSKSKYSSGTLTLTVGNGSVVFNDVTTSTNFNINGTAYKISGSKLVK